MREQIIADIRRLAKANGGQPPGGELFERETGIRKAVWLGVHWARWGDALTEAGFAPNKWGRGKSDTDFVLRKFIEAMSSSAGYRLQHRDDISQRCSRGAEFRKADLAWDVIGMSGSGSKADIRVANRDVRFTPESEHSTAQEPCPHYRRREFVMSAVASRHGRELFARSRGPQGPPHVTCFARL